MQKKKSVKFTNDEKLAIHGAVADKNYDPESKRVKKAEQLAKDKLAGKKLPAKDVIPLSLTTLMDDGEKLPPKIKTWFIKNEIDIKNIRGNLAGYALFVAFRLMMDTKNPSLSGFEGIAKMTGEIAPDKKIFGIGGITPEVAAGLEEDIRDAIKN